MKPTRIRMCHSLVMNYGLYKKMEIFVSLPPLGILYNPKLEHPTESQTRHKAGDDPVSLRRICRVSEQD